MEGCNCINPFSPTNELLIKYQYISDFFIALAYFSIPLELLYFANKSSSFPYRSVLIQFNAFIVLCGATHLINLWTFTMHTETVVIIMTVAKVATAVVSCATSLMLVHVIPDLLSVKTRESSLEKKAENLHNEMVGLIPTQVETGRQVSMLNHDVLHLSKLEDGSFKPDIGAFNLHDVFNEVMSFVKPIAAIKELSLSAILSPDLPLYAVGDEKRLMQIILSVCCNAIKFTKEGHISLLASVVKFDSLRNLRSADFHPVVTDSHFYVQVQVKDTGCGINPQDLSHVFTKFAHKKCNENQGYNDISLGLAICKRFVNLMDGHIWLESDGVGRGCTATFVVKLGVCDAC